MAVTGTRLKNLAGLFRNTRTRTIIIFTAVIMGLTLLIGIIRLTTHPAGPKANADIKGPAEIQSIPGGFDRPESPEYAQLQAQQNVAQAKSAMKRGTSDIPTIISSSSFQQPATTTTPVSGQCCIPCGCGAGSAAIGKQLPLGQPSNLNNGTLVYDAQGHVIGTLGPDGKVRDANGNIIGVVGPDGLVRDVNGNVIGQAAGSTAGTPVYDANGKLIGFVGPDGKVRDANGNVVGTVGPDGVVRDLNGNIIGKATNVKPGTPVVTGTPVYDAQGHLIGYVGADGKVRDASGKVIGTVGPDGVVRDLNGKIIGKAGAIVPGTPVYDANGRLIGTVGPDGKVRDANGNIIGTMGPDGVVRDANGNVVGKIGPTYTGTPIYDAQGRLIGIAGPDGKLRDANGKVIGTVGLDGVVRDADGNPIGSTTPPNLAAAQQQAGGATSTVATISPQDAQMQAALQRQAEMVSQQRAEQLQQQLQGTMSGQASQLLAAWVSPVQQYVVGQTPAAGAAGAGGATGPGGAAALAASAAANTAPPVVKAGDIMFAVLTTSVNSDEPGPILAKIVEGKFQGGKIIGTLTNQGEKVMLTFNTLSMPGVPRSVSIQAVAIDQNTARTGLSSYTNNHYLLRYGSLFASSFAQGYAQAFSTSGATVISNGLQSQTTYPNLSPSGKFYVALGNIGQQYSTVMAPNFNIPPTVYVNSGTAMGLLFLADVPPLPTS